MTTQDMVAVEAEPVVGAAGRRGRLWLWIVVAVVVAGVVVGAVVVVTAGQRATVDGELAIAYVRTGDMQITVVEDAELEAHDYHEIKCKVPGGSMIKTIHVKDGDPVEVGTPLFDLDTESLEEKITNMELEVENALATLEAAKKDLEIRIKQNETSEKKAADTVTLAKLDMDKYVLGEYPFDREEAKLAIEQARARLKMAKDDLRGSKTARDEGFVTEKEVEQNQLAVADAEFNLKKAVNNLELLQKYTYPREKRNRESNYEIALEDLERVKQQNANELAKVERDVKNKQIQYDLKAERLQELKDNLENSIVKADRAGTINFHHSGHRWRREMVEEGANIREGQVVMKIPDTSQMIVKFTISERDRYRVKIGQQAVVTVATLPSVPLYATLTAKTSRPDASQWWANPDVKLFACEAALNEKQPHATGELKLAPNTSAKIRVFVDTLNNVTYVPIQSVFRIGGKTLLATLAGGVPKLTEIEAGESNEDFIEIRSGVRDRQSVLLALTEPLKKELQVMRDAAAREDEENGEPPPPLEDAAAPQMPDATQRPQPAAGGALAGLTEAQQTQLRAVLRKLRDPANQSPEKRQALLNELDADLRKKVEAMLKRIPSSPGGRDDSERRRRPGSGGRSGRRPS